MIKILAPAKLNLGLEIIGKRPDGYHNLRTIFCTVSLFDRITIIPTSFKRVTFSDSALNHDNLVRRTLDAWSEHGYVRPDWYVHVIKCIPAAAGLGGASTDAAAVLLALAQESGWAPSDPRLPSLAAKLGSDVPFFLRGGLQLGSDRGEVLTPLQPSSFAAVVVTPDLRIAHKTRTLFASLTPADLSDGSQVDSVMTGFPASITKTAAPLINSFQRPLYDLYPVLGELAQTLRSVTGRYPSITGAGPSMFIPVPTIRDAHELRTRIVGAPLPIAIRAYCVRAIAASGLPGAVHV